MRIKRANFDLFAQRAYNYKTMSRKMRKKTKSRIRLFFRTLTIFLIISTALIGCCLIVYKSLDADDKQKVKKLVFRIESEMEEHLSSGEEGKNSEEQASDNGGNDSNSEGKDSQSAGHSEGSDSDGKNSGGSDSANGGSGNANGNLGSGAGNAEANGKTGNGAEAGGANGKPGTGNSDPRNSSGSNSSVKGILSSVNDINFHDVDGASKNYSFTYNGSDFQAVYTTDNWKVRDSYLITNNDDITIICEALIGAHPVHGKDMVSYRTKEDMAYEWQQHNLAYTFLPEGNRWKNKAKDVDLNPEDQGLSFDEIYERQSGKKLNLEEILKHIG